ncbi:helix-turn-helix transcriptional regulator [Streptomyces sp. DSM 44915]|uniref:Helix-turn-helix transcriptional regulator n=1 Tax=Streptomyces chisholmiae TaxID=3075540 RepID=A0ABU2JT50_9ACTN|nr:helix-turn-helix transcriptional regulator [Streptomyces sp. DSM 44915]MDT0268157.1 helix-turn-helix transcriptional regulator [Streptomyces sp. DSM 44915]
MTSGKQLGDFLRAHRARRRPDEVGLPSHGRRRVVGLRREEVAVLAGMNTDYYARLEQGRARHPSPQVLAAICGALRLDPDARAHVYRLAGVVPDDAGAPPRETVSAQLRELLDGYPHTPAFVLGPALDLLTANPLARALFSPFERADNLAGMVFLDPVGRHFHVHWHEAAQAVVASLRQATGHDPDYPRLRALVRELTEASAEFAALWATQTVHPKTSGGKVLRHPAVGELSLGYQTFDVSGAPGQQLVIYHAAPASPTAEALTLLGALAATRHTQLADPA